VRQRPVLNEEGGASATGAEGTVDFWRNVHTLNYEVLHLPGPGITEPTVSLWVPTNSCTGANCMPA
jgi:hypothetical protein